jgi:hypothetical protein
MEYGIRGMSKLLLLVPFFFLQFSLSGAELVGSIAAKHLLRADRTILKTFFCPKQGKLVEEIIIDLIGQSSEVIGAFYQFTRGPVIDALVRVKKENKIPVRLVIDQSAVGHSTDIFNLPDVNIPLYIHSSTKKKGEEFDPEGAGVRYRPLMHHKIFVCKNVLDGRDIVITGSMNMTYSGLEKNCENVLFADDEELVADYEKQIRGLMCQSFKILNVEPPQKTNGKWKKKKKHSVASKQKTYTIPREVRWARDNDGEESE